jgi:hypothetical protein
MDYYLHVVPFAANNVEMSQDRMQNFSTTSNVQGLPLVVIYNK